MEDQQYYICDSYKGENSMKHTQGFSFKCKVTSDSAKIVIRDTGLKIVISTIEQQNNDYYLTATAEETSTWPSGNHRYQLLDDAGVLEEGDFEVTKNFLLTDEDTCIKSKNELYLEAIEATIAGKATAAQSSMSVGDKSIQYMSVDELLKLREYFKGKVEQEQNKYSANNRGRIKYVWQMR